MSQDLKPDPTKRKIIIQAGQNREEIEVGADAKQVTIFKLGSDAAPATSEEFNIFIGHLKRAIENPDYVIMWNHRVEVLQPKL